MVARGGASLRAKPLVSDTQQSRAPEATDASATRSVAPPGLSSLLATVPGVGSLRSLHPWLPSVAPPGLQDGRRPSHSHSHPHYFFFSFSNRSAAAFVHSLSFGASLITRSS